MYRVFLFFVCFPVVFVSFSMAQEFPGVLDPTQVLQPVPAEYGSDKRVWQGVPSIAVAPNGRLWAAWSSGGSQEPHGDNYCLLATSSDHGKTWTEPLLVIDMPGPVRELDPALWIDPEGKLWFFWGQVTGDFFDGRAGVWCMTTNTPERQDAVWSTPKRICDGFKSTKSIVDSQHRWIHPVIIFNTGEVHPDRTFEPGTHFVVSEDRGKTWKSIGFATVPRKDALYDETNIVEKKDGSFWMLFRTLYGIGESFSTDNGKTWTEPKPSKFSNPSSRFFMRRLKSGNLLFVKNGGLTQRTGRSHLQAFLSDDDGQTWKGGLMLDERNQVSYPDGDQANDGTIFIIYDFERYGAREILLARFTEEDVLAGKIVSETGTLQILVDKATAPKCQFQANSNSDGKPLRFGTSPKMEIKNAKAGTVLRGFSSLFTDNNETLIYLCSVPNEFNGKKFVLGQFQQPIEVNVQSDGMVYVYTPSKERSLNSSVEEELLKIGFEKVARPETLIFGNSLDGVVTLYQKEVKTGETIKLTKWAFLIY
ncbi:MAG: glycoside hydrolase [Planctomycetaceae bacterium]|jgi:predicted neuraminidase|nr:glycoside hydrolase [Planctomycetaceae bacterium]